jgi:hypothetical protein
LPPKPKLVAMLYQSEFFACKKPALTLPETEGNMLSGGWGHRVDGKLG